MNDPVNHPAHYTQGKIEIIDCIESVITPLRNRPRQAYCIGSAVKYLARFSVKQRNYDGEIEDLEKAKRYIDMVIEDLKAHKRFEEGPEETPKKPTIDISKVYECSKCGKDVFSCKCNGKITNKVYTNEHINPLDRPTVTYSGVCNRCCSLECICRKRSE